MRGTKRGTQGYPCSFLRSALTTSFTPRRMFLLSEALCTSFSVFLANLSPWGAVGVRFGDVYAGGATVQPR